MVDMNKELESVNEYLKYFVSLKHKKEMGYNISSNEFNKLSELRNKALLAKDALLEEMKSVKKTLKRIK